MANGKRSNKTVLTILGLFVAFVLFAGIFYGIIMFALPEELVYETRTQGVTMQGSFYDSEGVSIKKATAQTIVTPQGRPSTGGIFYMSFRIYASNTGNVALNNLRYTSPAPAQLSQALQNSAALQSSLNTGQSNILLWDTANVCTTDAQCGTPAEKCVNTPQGNKCLIDISNFIGDINFQLTLLGNYSNLQGQQNSIQTAISLPVNFQQEFVVFRTNSLTAAGYGTSTTIVVLDQANDGTMESYLFNSAGSESYVPADFLGWTVQNNLIYRCGTSSNICISQTTSLNKDTSYPSLSRWKYALGGSSVPVSATPLEPYTSQNCAGVVNQLCQERYSIAVAPPVQECGDGSITGTEVCESSDLDGQTCSSQGFTGGSLTCSADCLSFNTNACTSGGVTAVNFRTARLSLDSSSSNDDAIAFLPAGSSCGTALTKAGERTTAGAGTTGQTCESYMTGLSYTKVTDLNIVGLTVSSGSSTGSSNPGLWRLNSDSTVYAVCADNPKPVYRQFKTNICSGACTSISTSSTSVNANLESTCTA